MHVLFDESNSLVENDAQDEDFELGLAKKDLLLTHEGKNPQVGSGTESVSKEEGQGFKQTGGTVAKPCLEQDNILETGARTVLQTGARTSLERGARTGPETGSKTGSEIGSRTGPEADTLGDWVTAMQEKLHVFENSKVCHLVSQPEDRSIIDTKWVFKNKLDKFRTVPRNKAKLVVQR